MRQERLISRSDWPPLEDQLPFRPLPDSLDRWLMGLRSKVYHPTRLRSVVNRRFKRTTVAERLMWRRVETALDSTRPQRPRRA